MPNYLISYDLRKQRNYDALIQQLRDWNCISPLRSVWLGTLNGTASGVRDALRKHCDGDDGLLVVELVKGADWATAQVNEKADLWLSAKVAP
ncbi:hypothetical protein ACP4J4_02670 [Aureimonas ureilytica]|uniref:hypothetical protein n=1 Tax=Aureimonas ureilytica TaxID=401562 RepID=UPI003CF3BCF4